MTITLELSKEQEERLAASRRRQDVAAARSVLHEAVEATLERMQAVQRKLTPEERRAVLKELGKKLRNAPKLPAEALSRESIYADHQ